MTADSFLKVQPQAEITHRVYFDIDINSRPAGRIEIGLYGDVVPKTVNNFKTLCAGTEKDPMTGRPLRFAGSPLHRIIPNFMIQVRCHICQQNFAFNSLMYANIPRPVEIHYLIFMIDREAISQEEMELVVYQSMETNLRMKISNSNT